MNIRTMIVLLGGCGYVGSAYRTFLESSGLRHVVISRRDVDYYQRDRLLQLLRDTQAIFLINSAGYTGKPNVDACELHKADCLLGNAVLPGIIREACTAANIPWGHVSSGCIYNGSRLDGRGFAETDPPNFSFRRPPCSFYSGTKALGEELLADAPACYVWRLRIPFNNVNSPRNYLTKVMTYERLLDARNSLSQLNEFVRATVQCWQQRLPFGTYNVTNPGAVTTREIVELIQQAGFAKKDYRFFDNEEEFMQIAAKTPRSNCVLDTTKLAGLGITMTEVHEAVASALRNWRLT
jgi:dTDP-4-dehydrorhamnose reductase